MMTLKVESKFVITKIKPLFDLCVHGRTMYIKKTISRNYKKKFSIFLVNKLIIWSQSYIKK